MKNRSEDSRKLREGLSYLITNHEILEESVIAFAKLEAAYYKSLLEQDIPPDAATKMAIAYIDGILRGIQ